MEFDELELEVNRRRDYIHPRDDVGIIEILEHTPGFPQRRQESRDGGLGVGSAPVDLLAGN